MRILLQRVRRARVEVEETICGEIGRGLLLFVCVEIGDGSEQVAAAARKVPSLRVFEDERGRMSSDVRDVHGGILIVSQFTLAASVRRGRRPSFDRAAPPELVEPLIDLLARRLAESGLPIQQGRFGAKMLVSLENEGPVTLLLEFAPSKTAVPNQDALSSQSRPRGSGSG